MSLIKYLKFWLYRRTHNGLPSRREALEALFKTGQTYRIALVLTRYSEGSSLQEIAQELNATRERIRQILLKGCRNNRKVK